MLADSLRFQKPTNAKPETVMGHPNMKAVFKYNYRISKILHIITLCSFLLPFSYNSCAPSAKEKLAQINAKSDSTIAIQSEKTDNTLKPELVKDTLESVSESVTKNSNVVSESNDTNPDEINPNNPNNEEETYSTVFVKKYPALKYLLIPKNDTRTGLGMVLDSSPYIQLYSILISFLLLTLCLLIKTFERSSRLTIMFLEVLAIIGIAISRPSFFSYELLWGFWVTLVFLTLLTIIDFVTAFLIKRSNIESKT